MGNTASDKKNARCYSLKFSKNTDAEIIEYLDSQPSIQGYIKSLIRADMKGANTMKEKIMIQFEAGEGRHFHGGVNYLLSLDGTIYAECPVPDDCSDDYGYLTLVKAIKDSGADLSRYTFWYDGQENCLAADASANCEVYTEIE